MNRIGKEIRIKTIWTIKIKLIDGPGIYFNIDENLKQQLDKLLVIKNEKIKDDFLTKQYIDLRFGDSVYFR